MENSLYQYTLREGGTWQDLPFSLPREEMIKRLTHKGNWGDCGELFPGECGGHTKRTLIIENPDDELNNEKTIGKNREEMPVKCFWVDALKFPNGDIWDSYLRDFRESYVKKTQEQLLKGK